MSLAITVPTLWFERSMEQLAAPVQALLGEKDALTP